MSGNTAHPVSNVVRRGFGLKEEIREELELAYRSPLIERIVENDYRLRAGEYEIFLAREFGFCHGVERAVNLAYETRKQFPDRRIFITAEMIHNPQVNENLRRMGFEFLHVYSDLEQALSKIEPRDIVLVPAFGASSPYFERLKRIGCVLVDTTCGEVMRVWKRVQSYARDGYTAVIHGKYYHEETIATSSRAGKFLIVRNKEEAQLVCDYIEGRGDRAEFLKRFENAYSENFDPDADLRLIGVANQTTMLSGESLQIAAMLKQALQNRYGDAEQSFRSYDTICSATQDRQDAIKGLLSQNLDLMLIIGGINSSNTTHLCEIANRTLPAFHIHSPSCLESITRIQHRHHETGEWCVTENWFPPHARRIGFTAGASTPNSIIEKAIARLLELLDLNTSV